MKIIMVHGKLQSGKDTFFKLAKVNFIDSKIKVKRFSFADALKRIASEFGWDGTKIGDGRWFLIDTGQILRGDYILKEICEKYNHNKTLNYQYIIDKSGKKTTRKSYNIVDLYKTLTNIFTPCKDFWSNIVCCQIMNSNCDYAIITDFRFQNEYYTMLKYFISTDIYKLNITRNTVISEFVNDTSENDIKGIESYNTIENNGTIDDYMYKVEDLFNTLH